jgi:uncharacterized RDD family membrane protein YckC
MSCFVYEGLQLFGVSLIPGIIGATWVAQTGHPLQSVTALRVFAFALYALYFTWFWSGPRGQTLAMQTWQVRVVTQHGERLGRGRALARFFAACIWFAPAALLAAALHWDPWQGLLAIVVGVVVYALLALLQPQRQFWHDVVCGTRLVAAPRPRR